ncbi:MAG: DEAD/DEAH box helicase [Actinobacteria bacterium]|nr:DEAD/DEAH box helicase [Actinomycetota bacterium]
MAALERFSEPARSWFSAAFAAPTAAQEGAWDAVTSGEHALVVAPTGSGKTLAAFLWSIDRLLTTPTPENKKERLRVLYVSPLKALAVDIERNLRSPLTGIRAQAARLGQSLTDVVVGMRTGDTPAEERRRFATSPPDVLITTPESLFLLLTSQARDALRFIDTVIIDEVHAVAGSKRGSHLALSLERLDELLARPAQRIGLSATVRPVEDVARFLAGGRPVRIVQPPSPKEFDLRVEVPVEDMGALGEESGNISSGPVMASLERKSIWPAVEARLTELIKQHRSTIVFANSRRLAERLCASINEEAGEPIARAHHGSVSREQRVQIEEDLKAGRLPCVVATSSLELGIDMGAVDLVLQVEAPTSVASGLQRIGRAGHQVGAVSRGVIFPKFRGDLVECAVVVERMKTGAIEAIGVPRNALDVLAQQIVAMVAMDEWNVDALEKLLHRAAPYEQLPRSALENVLDMLSGRYPSDEFAELRPRLTWDRIDGKLSARPGAQRLAVTSGGTIPDRGLYGVFMAGERASRVGELDEEMVYESRVGDVFVLGATSWRIEDITRDRVIVTPAPGVPGHMPFWHGDALGRPVELGKALGEFVRTVAELSAARAASRLASAGLDDYAVQNLLTYLDEQKQATGALPDDRTIVVERFRDELGDWRICVHSPFGARVHAPWAQAIESRVRERFGVEVQTMHTDDGIVVRLPEADEAPPASSIMFDSDEIEDIVVSHVGGSALFASRFRECAARALLLPKRRPDGRTPLWQQRQRSATLLQVASKHNSFPIVLETLRECLQDVFDLPGLRDLMAAIERREIRIVEVDTPAPSPFASSLQFGYVGAFMYEGDAPLAERRAQVLSLDRTLLAELLGSAELRELIDADTLTQLELELQRLTPERAARTTDELHDALRTLGDLSTSEACARTTNPQQARRWLRDLESARRALIVRVAGEERWIAAEDAARFRDALGTALPQGLPDAFLEPVGDPLGDLVARFARTHGPFHSAEVAVRLGLGAGVVEGALRDLSKDGRIVAGEFRPGAAGHEWTDADVLRTIRRRSVAVFRKEAEPVPEDVFARFLPAWQDVAKPRAASLDALLHTIEQLQGALLPASTLESQVLPARLRDYSPALLDQLCTSGEVVWSGAGALGADDGWIALALADHARELLPVLIAGDLSDAAAKILAALETRGAMFFRQIVDAIGSESDTDVLHGLWELVWTGHVTNDTLAPLRAMMTGGLAMRRTRRRGPPLPSRLGPPAATGRWSLTPPREPDATRRLHATAQQLLNRYGVVTRGVVVAERIPGGFAAIYGMLKAMEDAGRCRRGYFVEGLGGAQFADAGAVERLRSFAHVAGGDPLVLSATDPANPFGAALAWPDRDNDGTRHRAARKAGASVALAGGSLALYIEKGGKSLLSFTHDGEELKAVAAAVAQNGTLGTLSIERVDGVPLQQVPEVVAALREAGFVDTPKGLRLRA